MNDGLRQLLALVLRQHRAYDPPPVFERCSDCHRRLGSPYCNTRCHGE